MRSAQANATWVEPPVGSRFVIQKNGLPSLPKPTAVLERHQGSTLSAENAIV